MNFWIISQNIYTGKDAFGIYLLFFQKFVYLLLTWKLIPEYFVQI